jgi:hypothetical protein
MTSQDLWVRRYPSSARAQLWGALAPGLPRALPRWCQSLRLRRSRPLRWWYRHHLQRHRHLHWSSHRSLLLRMRKQLQRSARLRRIWAQWKRVCVSWSAKVLGCPTFSSFSKSSRMHKSLSDSSGTSWNSIGRGLPANKIQLNGSISCRGEASVFCFNLCAPACPASTACEHLEVLVVARRLLRAERPEAGHFENRAIRVVPLLPGDIVEIF